MTDNKKSYIGLTIGPIVETISNAKQTGELWARSYLFSYIMKNIIKTLIVKDKKFNKEKNQNKKLEDRFILPCINDIFNKLNKSLDEKNSIKKTDEKTDQENDEVSQEVGLFHDRFIFQSEEGDFDLVKQSIDEVIDCISIEIKGYEDYKDKSKEEIKRNIEDFLKIYYLELDLDLSEKEKEDKEKSKNNIIFKVNRALDALELREKISNDRNIEGNYLTNILKNDNMNNSKEHFLCKDAYGKDGKRGDYPSLFKIALSETYNGKFPNEDDEIKEKLREKRLEDKLIKANEYVAVVQADGDSMGKVIETFQIHNDIEDIYKDYKSFSSNLLEYDKESHKTIKKYGGFTIYAGGDDLLFIAPVINNKEESEKKNNIFQLIDKLSDLFDEKFNKEKEKPTTSFGVAIVHHKFPLYYALDEARDLLFNKAKNYKFNGEEKNAIAFKVIKSSGQSFETVVGKKSESYKQFKDLFYNVSKNLSGKDRKIKNYLNAIHFKLKRDKVILNKIGENKSSLQNYFDNNFGEKIHKTEPIKTYINDLIEFIYKIYSEAKTDEDKDKCIEQIYTYLRFIKFMDEDINLDD
ncbi:type III-B CRISPR-associated protein Cas10/Cmr2 [Clostridium sporogenes]|uniref:type III-B CRISPR-associated protein Cas10/Cmr2 n=1 Tax=Clostridium sporogenes TaxID=1509 RepID=UPI0015EFB862|nr:type III-B CRISPR-associated protein Cas10/Cmr2 [Clostridium sporogenes]MBA4509567.1 type III-B CRISPR-associated protein Cas10/Cmr2 [Clostridium sporogenes]